MMTSRLVGWEATAFGVAAFLGVALTPIGGASGQPAARKGEAPARPPAVMAERGMEGWAQVCHSVGRDGTVADIRVVDVSPRPEVAKAVRGALATWTYEPARIDGDTVDQHNVCELVVFELAEAERVTGKKADSQLDEAERLIESVDFAEPDADPDQAEKDLASARRILDQLVAEGPLDLSQGARLELLRYRLAVREKNEEEALLALQRATVGQGRFIDPKDRIPALGAQFTGLAQQGRYRDALGLFDLFEVLDGGALPMVVHGKAASSIRDLAASDSSFAVPAKLKPRADGEGAIWVYRPLRRELGVRGLQGSLKALVVECERRKIRLDYQEDVSWGIPASWGECTVYAEGDAGTTFELVEFAPTPEAGAKGEPAASGSEPAQPPAEGAAE